MNETVKLTCGRFVASTEAIDRVLAAYDGRSGELVSRAVDCAPALSRKARHTAFPNQRRLLATIIAACAVAPDAEGENEMKTYQITHAAMGNPIDEIEADSAEAAIESYLARIEAGRRGTATADEYAAVEVVPVPDPWSTLEQVTYSCPRCGAARKTPDVGLSFGQPRRGCPECPPAGSLPADTVRP
jgi:hypothetical protein